jgi:hypothetical protein
VLCQSSDTASFFLFAFAFSERCPIFHASLTLLQNIRSLFMNSSARVIRPRAKGTLIAVEIFDSPLSSFEQIQSDFACIDANSGHPGVSIRGDLPLLPIFGSKLINSFINLASPATLGNARWRFEPSPSPRIINLHTALHLYNGLCDRDVSIANLRILFVCIFPRVPVAYGNLNLVNSVFIPTLKRRSEPCALDHPGVILRIVIPLLPL